MSLVAIKNKYQIVIPAKVRREVALRIGDFLEASVKDGKITLAPKTLIDRNLAISIEDFKMGRTYGPFETHKSMMHFLKGSSHRLKNEKKN